MRLRCANCRRVLMSGDKQSISRVYGTHGACSLCESCTEHEEKAIQAKNTNDVPELRLLYLGERRIKQRTSEISNQA